MIVITDTLLFYYQRHKEELPTPPARPKRQATVVATAMKDTHTHRATTITNHQWQKYRK